MPKMAFGEKLKRGLRVIISVVAAVALVMPTFPLSTISPAYAETPSDNVAQQSDIANSQSSNTANDSTLSRSMSRLP